MLASGNEKSTKIRVKLHLLRARTLYAIYVCMYVWGMLLYAADMQATELEAGVNDKCVYNDEENYSHGKEEKFTQGKRNLCKLAAIPGVARRQFKNDKAII